MASSAVFRSYISAGTPPAASG